MAPPVWAAEHVKPGMCCPCCAGPSPATVLSALLGRQRPLPGVLLLGHRCARAVGLRSWPHAACMAAQQRGEQRAPAKPPSRHGHAEAAAGGRRPARRRVPMPEAAGRHTAGLVCSDGAFQSQLGIVASSQPRRWPWKGMMEPAAACARLEHRRCPSPLLQQHQPRWPSARTSGAQTAQQGAMLLCQQSTSTLVCR